MSKPSKETIQRFNARMIQKFPYVLDIKSSILFCKVCYCNINGAKIYSVQQHFRTLKHRNALQSAPDIYSFEGAIRRKVVLIPPPATVQIHLDTFTLDLCTTLLEANIPLGSVDNPAMQIFLKKYTKKSIPNETTLRSEYVPALYEKYIQKLQHKAHNNFIWISIIETSDRNQQLIGNFVFGLMEEDEKGKCYLLNMAHLERANASSLAAFINNSLQILWPEGIYYDNVQLAITNAIPYMMTALKSLKVLYPNMIYVNCLLQTYHRMIDYIRTHFMEVTLFIENCEAVFLKSPHRQHVMRSKYHYLNLPSTKASKSTPATWLNAAIYYCNNFNEINTLLEMFSDEDDACIQTAKQLMQNASLENDLVYLKQHFTSLSECMAKLETRDLTLNESLETVNVIRSAIEATKRSEFINKFYAVIDDNTGLQELIEMNRNHNVEDNFPLHKFAPVVSADVTHLSYAKSLLENDKTLSLRNLKQEKF